MNEPTHPKTADEWLPLFETWQQRGDDDTSPMPSLELLSMADKEKAIVVLGDFAYETAFKSGYESARRTDDQGDDVFIYKVPCKACQRLTTVKTNEVVVVLGREEYKAQLEAHKEELRRAFDLGKGVTEALNGGDLPTAAKLLVESGELLLSPEEQEAAKALHRIDFATGNAAMGPDMLLPDEMAALKTRVQRAAATIFKAEQASTPSPFAEQPTLTKDD